MAQAWCCQGPPAACGSRVSGSQIGVLRAPALSVRHALGHCDDDAFAAGNNQTINNQTLHLAASKAALLPCAR